MEEIGLALEFRNQIRNLRMMNGGNAEYARTKKRIVLLLCNLLLQILPSIKIIELRI